MTPVKTGVIIFAATTKGVRTIGKSYSSREVIRILKDDGWYYIGSVGDHKNFKHPVKKGRVTGPDPEKDIPPKTLESIMKQAGLPKLR